MRKESTKDKIIISAKEVFLEKGLFETFMEDIAVDSGLTRRTLYRYFRIKEDLAYEVVILILNEWNLFQKKCSEDLSGTGIEMLETFLIDLVGYMEDKSEVMRFMGEFDFYFKDGSSYSINEDIINRFNEIIHVSEDIIEGILKKGLDDQSIELHQDLKLIVPTITNVLWSFGQRIAIRNNMIQNEFDIEAISLIKCQIDVYLKALRRN